MGKGAHPPRVCLLCRLYSSAVQTNLVIARLRAHAFRALSRLSARFFRMRSSLRGVLRPDFSRTEERAGHVNASAFCRCSALFYVGRIGWSQVLPSSAWGLAGK